jgi:hypothetical protein
MKYLLLLLLGCGTIKQHPLPPEMKDCQVYRIYDGERERNIVVCPGVHSL